MAPFGVRAWPKCMADLAQLLILLISQSTQGANSIIKATWYQIIKGCGSCTTITKVTVHANRVSMVETTTHSLLSSTKAPARLLHFYRENLGAVVLQTTKKHVNLKQRTVKKVFHTETDKAIISSQVQTCAEAYSEPFLPFPSLKSWPLTM